VRFTEGTLYGAPRANPELLLPKRPGEHVWLCIASWKMPGEDILAAFKGTRDVTLMWDQENLADFSIGCFICEQQFSERLYHRKCPGEPRL
jgi:hypothetical protein